MLDGFCEVFACKGQGAFTTVLSARDLHRQISIKGLGSVLSLHWLMPHKCSTPKLAPLCHCPQVGEVLDGRYEVFACKGKGVFSTVLRARDLHRQISSLTGAQAAAALAGGPLAPGTEHPEVAIKVGASLLCDSYKG